MKAKNTSEYDQIRVLLIDDNPRWTFDSLELHQETYTELCFELSNEEIEYTRVPIIQNDSDDKEFDGVEDFFEIKILRTPEEIKMYRDMSYYIETLESPKMLGDIGYVPDIVCFDYALTGSEKENYDWPELAERYFIPTKNPDVHEILQKHGKKMQIGQRPDSGASKNLDNFGCYGGSLIVSYFKNHPCAPLPVTRKTQEDIKGTETAILEWYLEVEFEGVYAFFKEETDKWRWPALLKQALINYRNRLEMLVLRSTVKVNLDELLKLAEGKDLPNTLTIQSMYGTRRLPVTGLFIDGTDPSSDWATNLLGRLLEHLPYSTTPNSLKNAMDFSKALWNKYTGKICDDRIEFSELIHKREIFKQNDQKLPEEDSIRLEELDQQYNSINGSEFLDISDARDPKIRRWAALFQMIRLDHLYEVAKRNYYKNFDPDSEMTPNAVAFKPTREDFILALFPNTNKTDILPFEDFDLLKSTAKDSATREKWEKQAKNRWDDLEGVLSRSDRMRILEGKKSIDLSFRINRVINGQSSKGLLPGEKILLRAFASSLKPQIDNEPDWLKS